MRENNGINNAPQATIIINNLIFGFDGKQLNILLVQAQDGPFIGSWILPTMIWEKGDFSELATKNVEKLTNTAPSFINQAKTYSHTKNSTNETTIALSFISGVHFEETNILNIQNEQNGQWWSVRELPKLGYNQNVMVKDAIEKIRQQIYFEPIAFYLAKRVFTITELQTIYELILDRTFDRRNFSKKMLLSGALRKARRPELLISKAHSFYAFNIRGYNILKRTANGNRFEF